MASMPASSMKLAKKSPTFWASLPGVALVAAAGDAEALGSAVATAEAAGCPQAELEAAKAELDGDLDKAAALGVPNLNVR